MLEVENIPQVPSFHNSTYLDLQVGLTRNLGARHIGNKPRKKQYGLRNKVLLGMSYGTHWELEKCFENLMGTHWDQIKNNIRFFVIIILHVLFG
jgi:hypothetical protein